jgi:alpha-L-fucosidase
MVKIVSRGGNYLLNIGPDALGNIPKESIDILDRVGEFLKLNGDSIYATTTTDQYIYDVEDCLFTSKPYKLYIHLFSPMAYLQLLNIGNRIKRAYILSTGEEIDVTVRRTCEDDSSWEFYLPKDNWPDDIDTVICVEMEEERPVFEPIRE